jgi:hypothetical protein
MGSVTVLKTNPQLFSMVVKTALGEILVEVDQVSGAVRVDGANDITAIIPYWRKERGLEWANENKMHGELEVQVRMPGTNGDCTIALMKDDNVVTGRPRSLAVVKDSQANEYLVLARDGIGNWDNEYKL